MHCAARRCRILPPRFFHIREPKGACHSIGVDSAARSRTLLLSMETGKTWSAKSLESCRPSGRGLNGINRVCERGASIPRRSTTSCTHHVATNTVSRHRRALRPVTTKATGSAADRASFVAGGRRLDHLHKSLPMAPLACTIEPRALSAGRSRRAEEARAREPRTLKAKKIEA